MKAKGRIYPMKKLTSLVGVVGISFLLGFPALAQFKTEGKVQVSEQTMPSEVEEIETQAEEMVSPPEEVTEPTMEPPTSQELNSQEDESATLEEGNLSEVAAANESLTTFLAAIEAAGLTQALNEENSITIFAPSNAAFEALPEGTLESLLQQENQETLRRILAYHVIEGKVTSSDIEMGQVTTAEGNPIDVQINGEAENMQVSVNEAKVVEADLEASNGVIHVIDKVMLPPEN